MLMLATEEFSHQSLSTLISAGHFSYYDDARVLFSGAPYGICFDKAIRGGAEESSAARAARYIKVMHLRVGESDL